MISRPLADRLRPNDFDDIAGQSHLFSKNGSLRRMIEANHITNMIFYGPPGIGKTTAANIIADKSNMELFKLNATTASLADIKEVAQTTATVMGSNGVLLYLDEIQYFNRKQQQSLLEYIEDGRITLIASTTENPYFYIYSAIISRSAVFEFKPPKPVECIPMLKKALAILCSENSRDVICSDVAFEHIAQICSCDVRRSIGFLENLYYYVDNEITVQAADEFMPEALRGISSYDRNGNEHFILLSAFQKSIRGSDPNAAIFYLAKLLCAGELLSVCRRLQVIASEDIGLAYPMAASIVYSCCMSAKEVGLPEASIPLSNATIMLATAPKSATAYQAYAAAKEDVMAGAGVDVPDHLKNASYPGSKPQDYKYPHNYENDYVYQQYLPSDIKNKKYYTFGNNKTERAAKEYFEKITSKKI